jgi:tetratricopeptide (TPR) repeat protein
MTEDHDQIQPKAVPLTSVQSSSPQARERRGFGWLAWIVGGGSLLALLFAVFLVLPGLVTPPVVEPVVHTAVNPDATPQSASAPQDPGLAPFAALQREQAREKAQKKLSEFVELQLQLEEKMQVGAWGQERYDAAKALATRGDEEFLDEKFDAALSSYGAAAEALAALIDEGEGLLADALEKGARAVDARDQAEAERQYQIALTIDPDNETATAGLKRAALLPQITVLLRRGKNQELAGEWEAALATYEEVRALDPATSGLEDAIASVRAGVRDDELRGHLSKAFAALEAGRYEAARQSFRAALAIDPGNSTALGGMEQVARRTDVSRIERLQQQARDAAAEERWADAIAAYDEVLSLDANIQFAKDGRARAVAQQRTAVTLANIIAAPDKLSSPKLFDQAKDILVRAERLEPRGPALAQQIDEVSNLIRVYSTPVQVTFRSDNVTNVTVSTIGMLGTFDEKQLTLRPGAYTVIGSRDGCRDVRTSILVRPDMQPVDIRCTETF